MPQEKMADADSERTKKARQKWRACNQRGENESVLLALGSLFDLFHLVAQCSEFFVQCLDVGAGR
jgi:hypothetical protein